jgi:hypothetical protein
VAAYIKVTLPSGELIMVIVLELGHERKRLEQDPVHIDDEFFAAMAKLILTLDM